MAYQPGKTPKSFLRMKLNEFVNKSQKHQACSAFTPWLTVFDTELAEKITRCLISVPVYTVVNAEPLEGNLALEKSIFQSINPEGWAMP